MLAGWVSGRHRAESSLSSQHLTCPQIPKGAGQTAAGADSCPRATQLTACSWTKRRLSDSCIEPSQSADGQLTQGEWPDQGSAVSSACAGAPHGLTD